MKVEKVLLQFVAHIASDKKCHLEEIRYKTKNPGDNYV